MKRPLRLGEGMRDEQGWHATDCQPIVSQRSIRVRQIHKRVKTLRLLVGATGFEPAIPCAQGKLGVVFEVLISERCATCEMWCGHFCGLLPGRQSSRTVKRGNEPRVPDEVDAARAIAP